MTAGPAVRADSPDPFTFERVRAVAIQKLDAESLAPHLLSLSIGTDGAYFGLAQMPSSVRIWSVKSGAMTADFKIGTDRDSQILTALVGDPCVAVSGMASSFAMGTPDDTTPVAPLTLTACDTGKQIAEVIPAGVASGRVHDILAVPACGLVVARYTNGVAVLDVARKAIRPDLSLLFTEAEADALESLSPALRQGAASVGRLAASSGGEECVVYSIAQELGKRAKTMVPGKIHEFDLRSRSHRVAHVFSSDTYIAGASFWTMSTLAVTPSRRYAVLSTLRWDDVAFPASGPNGSDELQVVDLRRVSPETHFDARHLVVEIKDSAFLDDRYLLVRGVYTTDVGTRSELVLFDRELERAEFLCPVAFGVKDHRRWRPLKVSVNAARKLIAVAFAEEVAVFRYRSNAAGALRERECSDD